MTARALAPAESVAHVSASRGELRVERLGARSVVTKAYAESPLRWLNPKNHGGAAWVFGATYGGGLVGGDALRIDVGVGPGAGLLMSTQASTKVYRSTHGARLALDAAVGAGGRLILLPDPVVCFRGSSYRQTQRIDLDEGAGLVLVDWMTSGRRASGERWQFDRYASRLSVRYAGRLALFDSLLLTPEEGDLPDRLGRLNVLCVIAIAGPDLVPYVDRAIASISSRPVERRARTLIAGSRVGDHGGLVRIGSESVEEAAAVIRSVLSFVPGLLGDDPWVRKW